MNNYFSQSIAFPNVKIRHSDTPLRFTLHTMHLALMESTADKAVAHLMGHRRQKKRTVLHNVRWNTLMEITLMPYHPHKSTCSFTTYSQPVTACHYHTSTLMLNMNSILQTATSLLPCVFGKEYSHVDSIEHSNHCCRNMNRQPTGVPPATK